MAEISSSIVGGCLDHPDRSGTPCSRCGTFRCNDCLSSGLCLPCRQLGTLRAPSSEDTVGFGPRAGGRIVDLVAGFPAGFIGGIFAGITLAILEVAGATAPRWAGRLEHGFMFNLLVGYTAGMVSGGLSTTICGTSLGKLLFGLRVVESSGRRPGFASAMIREAAYIVDSFFFGLVGKAAMDASALQQRHGDRWADTIVVRKDAASEPARASGGRLAAGILLGLAAHGTIVAVATVLGAM